MLTYVCRVQRQDTTLMESSQRERLQVGTSAGEAEFLLCSQRFGVVVS